jgi:hypothetical protein
MTSSATMSGPLPPLADIPWGCTLAPNNHRGCAPSAVTRGSPADLLMRLRPELQASLASHDIICCLRSSWSTGTGCRVEIELWHPFACQGGAGARFGGRVLTCCPSSELHWTRPPPSSSSSSEPHVVDNVESNVNARAFKALFSIVLALEPYCLKIEVLGNDMAARVLAKQLVHSPGRRVEFTDLAVHGNIDPAEGIRQLDLATHLLRQSQTIASIFFPNFGQYGASTQALLFQALRQNRTLTGLDLSQSRYLDTWTGHDKASTNGDGTVRAQGLVEALQQPHAALQALHVSGYRLVDPLPLVRALPHLQLVKLSLRDTCLDEATLLALVRYLRQDTKLRELDLSHNPLTCQVMEELVASLQENESLESLKLEHCEIDLAQALCVAQGLPSCKGLLHLSLNGNDFTWNPLHEGQSVGATALVQAVQAGSSSSFLQTLDMGDFGHIGGASMVCCSSPTYKSYFDRAALKATLQRNQARYRDYRQRRLQESVCRIATLLLDKTNAVP